MSKARVMELGLQGFGCSQILLLMALEAQGKENPDLVRAVSGLHGGLGFSGKTCGALTGGCCVLALYAGRGGAGDVQDPSLVPMVQELVEWFEREYGPRYGGIDCATILQDDTRNQITRCPEIVAGVFEKIVEILHENGHALDQGPRR